MKPPVFTQTLLMKTQASPVTRSSSSWRKGRPFLRATYRAALALQARLRSDLSDWITPCDAVVTISATGEAPLGIEYTGDAAFCSPWTFMGVPAITIPSGWSSNGLPLGLQIVAPFGRDKTALQIAAWAEEALNWQPRRIE